jgi:oligopeptide transport system substrate-binding protein
VNRSRLSSVPGTIIIAAFMVAALFALPRGVSVHAMPASRAPQTLTAAFNENFTTLDPAVGYDFTSWTGERAIFNGLLGYRNAPGRKGTQLIPDIAASMPTVGKSGLSYTFHLRHNVHFAPPVNRMVTAADFKYSIERALSPRTTGAAMFESPFWASLVGVSRFWSKKAAHIAGIRVLGRFAIQFHLAVPDVPFLNVLGMPFADVVPHEWVKKESSRFADNPVGTGPYMLTSWHQNVNMVLSRNPNYFRGGLPHIPRIHIDFGVNPDLQVERAEKGQLDLPGDFVSSSDYLKILGSSYRKQLVTASDVAVRYLAMNMQMKPFKGNLALRQAINMAVNKPAIMRLLNQRGVAMNGILPPTMPGANRRFTYYKYNQVAAKRLLKKAGYKPGQLTIPLMYDDSNDDYATVVTAVQSDLGAIGINVTPRPVSDNTYYSLIYSPGKSPFTLGVWGEDYPDPSDFFDPILSCTASSNAAFYCNHAVDRLGSQARADRNPKTRYAIYRKMERMVMAQAPWAPIYDDEEVDFRGAKVDGFFIHPVWPFTYDQYRLK